ncbi:ABC transporter permease [Acidobacteriota bacterium]
MEKKTKRVSPPSMALRILRKASGSKDYDYAQGDLIEAYECLVEEKGSSKANLWFWAEVIRSLPGFVKNSIYWSMAMFKNYVKIAIRNILRNKLFATINILGLSVGMACFILIALWVRDELSFDKFHEHKEELYLMTIRHHIGDILDPNVPYALAPLLATEHPEIVSYTRIVELSNTTTCSFQYHTDDDQLIKFYEDKVCLVDSIFFSMLSFPFTSGNPETALENPNSVVISEEMAEKYFGLANPLGKKLTLNNSTDLIVSGVIRIPSNSHLQIDFLSPLKDKMENNWNWADPTYIQLGKETSIEDFRESIAGSLLKHFPGPLPEGQFTVDILPLDKVHLAFGRMTYIYIFSVIAIFILFIACINYMNLSTASSNSRAKEVGLRKVVGAKRSQLINQFLGESTLLTAVAFLLSIVLVRISLPLLNTLTSKHLTLAPFLNIFTYLFVLAFLLVVGLISGSYPALFLSSSKPVDTLRSSLNFKTNRSGFRQITVVAQFTISVLLIACTVVVFRQLVYIQKRPLGFNTDYVLKIPINRALLGRYLSYKNELLRNPNISSVTASQIIPYDGDFKTGGIEWDTMDQEFSPLFRYTLAHLDYFETFGMEIVEGRSFSKEFATDRNNYIINEEAAKYMNMENPVGQRLKFWGQEGQIIGVVKDFHQVSLHKEIMPQIFTINPRHFSALKYIFVKVSSANIPETIAHIKGTTERMTPNFPFEYSFLDQGIGDLYQSEKRLGRIFGYFALLAIFISCLGILGLSAFTAEQRTKEIGIRKILGSSVSGIILLLSKEFSKWILLANAIAWPLAWFAMNKWLQSFAYRTGINLGVFVLAGFLSILIAAIPVSYQAIKAAFSNPIDALRYE